MRGKTAGLAVTLLLGAAAVAASPSGLGRTNRSGQRTPLASTLDCASHRFETTIHLAGSDGKIADQTVRMCGVKGTTDAEWLATLKDAIRKTAASTQMPQAAKDQIITAVNAEIGRLSLGALDLPGGPDITKLPKPSPTRRADTRLSRDYNALPPLPTASTVPPPHVLGPNGAIVEDAHVTLRCAIAGDEGRPEACESIDKDTLLVVRADQAYPNGLSVRFMRHGNSRAEVELPAMRAGETRRLRLPPAVCSGVVRSTLEVDALGANGPQGAVAAKVGEYDLRC